MCNKRIQLNRRFKRGSVLVMAMIFVAAFSALAVSMASFSSRNINIADNQRKSNIAISAAQSAIEYGKYYLSQYDTPGELANIYSDVTHTQADLTWDSLCSQLGELNCGSGSGLSENSFSEQIVINGAIVTAYGEQIETGWINVGDGGGEFKIRFFKYNDDYDVDHRYYDSVKKSYTFLMDGIGRDGVVTRTVRIKLRIGKENGALSYAIATRGRMIATGDTIIHGSILSTWTSYRYHAPVELEEESTINGKINVLVDWDDLDNYGNQMETLDEFGDNVYDEFGNKVISSDDTIQGNCHGVNYDVPSDNIPAGLDVSDYNTDMYYQQCSRIRNPDGTVVEYFPHSPGNYTRSVSGSQKFYRNLYTNDTFTDTYLPEGEDALFVNCTFNGIFFVQSEVQLYVRYYYGRRYYYYKRNNVRFENCTFNGIIVSSVANRSSSIEWVQNCLYFTGSATFDKGDDDDLYSEATILAPMFNVNLGNTQAYEADGASLLTGAIVGGIVDVRGNAEIKGTIISMYNTNSHSNGYVTNIGFAEDGGSEGGVPGDVGTIRIMPDPNNMLPGGIRSDVVIKPDQTSYIEL